MRGGRCQRTKAPGGSSTVEVGGTHRMSQKDRVEVRAGCPERATEALRLSKITGPRAPPWTEPLRKEGDTLTGGEEGQGGWED